MRAIERRSYLRIRERATAGCRVINDHQQKHSTLHELLGLDSVFALRKELYKLELESRDLQREISESDRRLGSFLHNLNQRVELLTALSINNKDEVEPNIIDLSPAGISFVSPTLHPIDAVMAIKIDFLSSSLAIAAFGRVRYSLLGDKDQYQIGIQFTSIDQTTEALIERHIAMRQAEERRERLHRV